MFENESLIDDNLLKLAKALKNHVKEPMKVKLLKDLMMWVLEVPWMENTIVNITCYPMNKNKFRLWADLGEVRFEQSVPSVSQVISRLYILKYYTEGIPEQVIKFLAMKSLKVSIEKAVKLIAVETDIILTPEQMEILGITEQKGRFAGKKFGL